MDVSRRQDWRSLRLYARTVHQASQPPRCEKSRLAPRPVSIDAINLRFFVTGLRIAFAGTPEFALPALRALADSHHTLVGVLTQPDRPSGRGQKLTASPVKQAALERGLEVA